MESHVNSVIVTWCVLQDLQIVYSYLHGMEALSNLREHQLRYETTVCVCVWWYFHSYHRVVYLTLLISFTGWCVRQYDMNSMKLMRFYTSEYANTCTIPAHKGCQKMYFYLGQFIRGLHQSHEDNFVHTHLLTLPLSQTQTHTDICLVLT